MAYSTFYLLPQTLLLFGPFVGLVTSSGTTPLTSRIQELLLPAAALAVVYSIATKTRWEGAMSVVLGFSIIGFLLYVFQDGKVAIATQQTTSTGLQVTVVTAAGFMPLAYLLMMPVCVFIAKGGYLSYSAMKETPRSQPKAEPAPLPSTESP
ncbi:MAG TPA: hypothetical protein VMS77_02415 [Conexivisphaerales archaeon]|nr:hypothetical protein [Conexivisphaerales archaeon]